MDQDGNGGAARAREDRSSALPDNQPPSGGGDVTPRSPASGPSSGTRTPRAARSRWRRDPQDPRTPRAPRKGGNKLKSRTPFKPPPGCKITFELNGKPCTITITRQDDLLDAVRNLIKGAKQRRGDIHELEQFMKQLKERHIFWVKKGRDDRRTIAWRTSEKIGRSLQACKALIEEDGLAVAIPSDDTSMPNEEPVYNSHMAREEVSSEGTSADDESREMETSRAEMLEVEIFSADDESRQMETPGAEMPEEELLSPDDESRQTESPRVEMPEVEISSADDESRQMETPRAEMLEVEILSADDESQQTETPRAETPEEEILSADDESRQTETPRAEMPGEVLEMHGRAMGSIIKQMFDRVNADCQSAMADIQELREELAQMRRNIM